MRIIEALLARSALVCLVLVTEKEERVSDKPTTKQKTLAISATYKSLGILNMTNAHILDLLRRQQPELDFFNCAERRARIGKVEVRHDAVGGDVGSRTFASKKSDSKEHDRWQPGVAQRDNRFYRRNLA
jgi:hypothetical protein